jgi:arylsulfatase A-like enzyme
MRVACLCLLLVIAGCGRTRPPGPVRLLEIADASGRMPKAGALASGGDTRPALLESARYRVRLPRRGLLTYGIGLAYASADEAPGWYHVTVRLGDRLLEDRRLNPRTLHGFRDISLPLGGSGEATLFFELRLTDRDGKRIETPNGMQLGVAEPTLHDLDDYGKAKGIVLVSIDTLRRDHVGAYGYPRPTTPRLDALAGDGLLCEDAVSTSSWTLPAHLSMLTSVAPGVHGGTDLNHGFNHRVPTLAALLRKAGYATQAITSHLYVSAVYGLDDGFDRLDFHQDRKADDVAERAIDVLDRVGDRPFFLFLHFYDAHWHYDPPPDRLQLFETGYKGQVTGLWQDFSRRDPKRLSEADVAHLKALYDGEIRFVDDSVGRVLDHLKSRGLDASTLVVVTSDHGEEFLDHGSWEHQKTLYEEVVRIPMLVRGPGVPARREPAQVSLLDVSPTVLSWAGLAVPQAAAGRSLLGSPAASEAYGETDHTPDRTHKLFLRAGAGRWKAIVTLAANGARIAREEWYDLASDPGEQRDARPPAAVADAIRGRAIDRWHRDRSGAAAPEVHLTPEQQERLKALGYVDR